MALKPSGNGKAPASTTIKGSDFETAPLTYKQQLVVGVTGLEKTGKSSWAFTAPDPVAVMDIDIGMEGVIQKHAKLRRIVRCTIQVPARTAKKSSEVLMKEARGQLDKFHRNYDLALSDPQIRTVVIDNSTSLNELVLLAHFGKSVQIPQHLRTLPNLEMAEIVRRPLADPKCSKNVIHILQMKKQYKGDEWDGKSYEWAGYNKMAYLVQAMLRTTRDKNNKFWIEVTDCRHDPRLNGEKYLLYDPAGNDEPDCGEFSPFSFVAANIIDGTSPLDWE